MVKPGPKPRPVIDRFREKTAPGENGCIVWTASGNGAGYGAMFIAKGKRVLAHRWAYEYYIGPIPEGLTIDHLCRNRACVNTDHLEPVSHRVNTLRGTAPTAVNAAKTHCPKGHPHDEQNTSTTSGGRECRACRREQAREYYQRNREKVIERSRAYYQNNRAKVITQVGQRRRRKNAQQKAGV